ncbi:phosphopantetheine-binding protein [Stenotrophomonas sp.]|uniref:acyl carrier protein n=1 Tax=Stenotrophomonas sp. TaxID=69392 RepID=UPI002FCBD516
MTCFHPDDLRQLIAAQLGLTVAEVGVQARLVEDLGIDSLAMHALLLDIEEAGIGLPDAGRLQAVDTVGALYAALQPA